MATHSISESLLTILILFIGNGWTVTHNYNDNFDITIPLGKIYFYFSGHVRFHKFVIDIIRFDKWGWSWQIPHVRFDSILYFGFFPITFSDNFHSLRDENIHFHWKIAKKGQNKCKNSRAPFQFWFEDSLCWFNIFPKPSNFNVDGKFLWLRDKKADSFFRSLVCKKFMQYIFYLDDFE